MLCMFAVEGKLRKLPPGIRIEAARDFGIDLTLLIERLRKMTEKRVRDIQHAIGQ